MKLMVWLLALSAYSITIECSLKVIVANPGGIGGIYKGPDSETIVHGPDGSVITAQQQGGIIQTESKLDPIVVADQQILDVGHPEIVQSVTASAVPVTAIGALSGTVVAPLEPVAASVATVPIGKPIEIVEQDPHIIETEIIEPPAIELNESTDLVGPSGSISTRGSESIVSGPASTTITKAAKILIAAPKILGVPIISAVSTPIQAPPLNEVNNEIPLSSPVPLNPISLSNHGHIGISTVAPSLSIPAVQPEINQALPLYPINGPTVSSAAPPLSIASTLTPPVEGQEVPLFPNHNLRVPTLGNVGLGSPPILRQPPLLNNQRIWTVDDTEHVRHLGPINPPLNNQRILTIDNTEQLRHLGPINPLNNQRILTVDDNEHARHLGPINPSLLQQAPLGPTQRPVLLTGEQYDPSLSDLRSGGVVSTLSPPIGSSTSESVNGISITPESVNGISISTEDNSRLVQIGGGVQSSTAVPLSSSIGLNSRQNVQNVPNEWLINRHLVIDPAQIPQHNIVPPETGIPKGYIDLGSTVQTHTTAPDPDTNGLPRAIGLSSSNIQRIDNNSLQRINNNAEPTDIEHTFQNGYYQNEILVGNTGEASYSQSPITSNANPISSEISIPSRGILDRELTKADIDSSQIQLTNVPLSDVTGLQSGPDSSRTRDYDDNVGASLWNRYGRRRRNRKY